MEGCRVRKCLRLMPTGRPGQGWAGRRDPGWADAGESGFSHPLGPQGSLCLALVQDQAPGQHLALASAFPGEASRGLTFGLAPVSSGSEFLTLGVLSR